MNLDQIRRATIVAFFSDDWLFEKLALKGGNALRLVYGISPRTSLDIDFSLEGDFDDPNLASATILATLERTFRNLGHTVFDFKFDKKPKIKGEDLEPHWGGYLVRFKLIETAKFEALQKDHHALIKYATEVDAKQGRVFRVEISKFEYTKSKIEREVDSVAVNVYSAEMIAIEKLRAICQQMKEYRPESQTKTPRARDFYDIYVIDAKGLVDWRHERVQDLAKVIFEAKQVSLNLLTKIEGYREFHRSDWPAVENAVAETLQPFDFYFDHILETVALLKSLWEI